MIIGGLRFWNILRKNRLVRRSLLEINSAKVGILAAAFYDPVFMEGISDISTGLIAVGSLILSALFKAPA
jgi:chromate transporter